MDPENKQQNKVIETYAEDMATVIGNDTEGLIKKIIHGEEQNEIEKRKLSPESKQNQVFMYIGVVLLVLAFGVLTFFFLQDKKNTVPVEKQFTPLVFNDKSVFLEVAGLKAEAIRQMVLSEINTSSVKDEGVEGIYLTENKKVIGLRRFLSLIKSNLAPNENVLLVSDNFLLGMVGSTADVEEPSGSGFFILLKARSTFDIFDSMRAWEDKMFSDLRGFLGISIDSNTSYLLTKDFEDGIVENKNARILYDKEGKIVLMYIFADENSVVITDSEGAIHEVVLRLASKATKE
ncbi:MAG: hypothetical protein WCT44_00905 [Candidatus Paceibacterota bacterium]